MQLVADAVMSLSVLSNILGDNLLPLLQDGQLNVLVQDDCVIDYATLNLDVVPVPSAVILGGLGLAVASWRLRRMKDNKEVSE